jgi:hypothetical protein
LTAIREACPCGAYIDVEHPDPAPIAEKWRGTHRCRRDRALDDTEPLGLPREMIGAHR